MGRETMIKNIREALRQKNEVPKETPAAAPREGGDVALGFASQWVARQGSVAYCTTQQEVTQELESHPEVWLCEALVADSGTLVLSDREGLRTDFAHMPSPLVVAAFTSQAVPDWESAVELMRAGEPLPRNIVTLNPDDNIHLILIEDL